MKRRPIRWESVINYTLLGLYLIFCLFPILWIVVTSFKTQVDINSYPPRFVFTPTLDNYADLFNMRDFTRPLLNSILASAGSTLLVMALGIPAAYAIARYNVGGNQLRNLLLSMRMMPVIALVLPIFVLFRFLGMLQTIDALILLYALMNLPFAIWLMIGFFEDVPVEINEAALLDGCNVFGALWRVNVPAAAPGLAAAAILSVIFAWNEFIFAVIIGGGGAKTLPVSAASFITDRAIFWGPMSAASTIALIPMVIFALFVQRYLVRGLAMGAVK